MTPTRKNDTAPVELAAPPVRLLAFRRDRLERPLLAWGSRFSTGYAVLLPIVRHGKNEAGDHTLDRAGAPASPARRETARPETQMRPHAKLASSIRRSGIREIMDLAAGKPDVLHLEVGEPDFLTPAHVMKAADEAARAGFTKYTPNKGLLEVRESLAAKLERRNGITANPEQIVVSCGAVNSLATTVAALLDPDDAVLIPDPSWPNYEMMIRARHAVPVHYPLSRSTGFQPDLEELERLAAETPAAKAIFVNSPSNPTGAVFPTDVIQRILEVAQRHDLYVISDDVYEDIVFDGSPPPVPGCFDRDGRVVSIFSASKSYAMTGWRIGYLAANPELANTIAKLQEAMTSCASSVSQKAAQAAIDGDQGCVEEMRRAYARRRDLAVDLLGESGILAARPQGAFYVMCDVSSTGKSGLEFARSLLTEHGVAVAPGETFGPGGSQMVRASLAAADDVIREGLTRIIRATRES